MINTVNETANAFEVTLRLTITKTLIQDLKCIAGIDAMAELRSILGAEVVGTLEHYLVNKKEEVRKLLEP